MVGISIYDYFNTTYQDRVEILDSERKGEFEGKVEDHGVMENRQLRVIDGCVRVESVTHDFRAEALAFWAKQVRSNHVKKELLKGLLVTRLAPAFFGISKLRQAQKEASKQIQLWGKDHIETYREKRLLAKNGFDSIVENNLLGKYVTRKEAAAAWREKAQRRFGKEAVVPANCQKLDAFFNGNHVLNPKNYAKKPKKKDASKFDQIREKFEAVRTKYGQLKREKVLPIQKEISEIEAPFAEQVREELNNARLHCIMLDPKPHYVRKFEFDGDSVRWALDYSGVFAARKAADLKVELKEQELNRRFIDQTEPLTRELKRSKKKAEEEVALGISDDVTEIFADMQAVFSKVEA